MKWRIAVLCCIFIVLSMSTTSVLSGDGSKNPLFDVTNNNKLGVQTGTGVISNPERVSIHSDGTQANDLSEVTGISDNGRYVVFQSVATNLIDSDNNGWMDIFRHDTVTGETIRVSVASDGSETYNVSQYPAISGDGRFVTFQSGDSGLVPITIQNQQVYLHDTITGETTLVSVDSSGEQGDDHSKNPAISGDGRFIAFNSWASNLTERANTFAQSDILLFDRLTGITTLVSKHSDGTQADNATSDQASISADGNRIAFRSDAANLVDNDTNGERDIFVHDRTTEETVRVSIASDGSEANGLSHSPAISANGKYVAFISGATNLVSNDSSSSADVFVHEIETGKTIRVSVSSSGEEANGGVTGAGPTGPGVSISGDGRFIAFIAHSNTTNLAENDTNLSQDIYIHDRDVDEDGINDEPGSIFTSRISIAYNGEEADGHSHFPAISASGQYVAFWSLATNLIQEGDTNICGIYSEPGECPDIFVYDRGEQTSACSLTTDSDGDGLLDGWEWCGYYVNGYDPDSYPDVNLPAMGANPYVKDIFVEVDYMEAVNECNDSECLVEHTHRPHDSAIKDVVDAFQRAGIHLHVDYGRDAKLHWGDGETWGSLSRGNWIPHANYLSPIGSDFSWELYRQIKLSNFTYSRWEIFHYAVFAHYLGGKSPLSVGGKGFFPGSDFVVTLGWTSDQRGTPTEQAGTFMHELGHNLSLQHGGLDNVDGKPNYLSVMNRLFTYNGLIYDSEDGGIDFSSPKVVAAPLFEYALDEPVGLLLNNGNPFPNNYGTRWFCKSFFGVWSISRVTNADDAINWDCQGFSNGMGITADINQSETEPEELYSYDDWGHISFGNGCLRSFQDPNCILFSNNQQKSSLDYLLLSESLDEDTWPVFSIPYSVRFEQSGKLVVPPGVGGTIPLTLTNTGELTATISITNIVTGDWFNVSALPASVTLTPNESVSVNVELAVPSNALAGEIQELSLLAFTNESPRMRDIVDLEIHAGTVPWFAAEPVFGSVPHEVYFSDLSLGEISNWSWNFGDGSTSNQQNPSHLYTSPGIYSVSLTVTSSSGVTTYTFPDLVTVISNQLYLPIIWR